MTVKNKPSSRKISHRVSERILAHSAENEPFVVVPRNGTPSRCFSLAKYEKMRAQPKKHRPWERRKEEKAAPPDPLGAVPGKVTTSLRREDIYE
jgi:hypothetical protein